MLMADNVKEVINLAEQLAANNEYMTPEHILNACLYNDEAKCILKSCGASLDNLKKKLDNYIKSEVSVSLKANGPVESFCFKRVAAKAETQMKLENRAEVEIQDILLSIYNEDECYASICLKEEGVTKSKLFKDGIHTPCIITISSSLTDEKYLKKYTIDLTEMAQQGKIPPLIGRDKEIRQTIEVLGRYRKKNVIYCSDPGCGKTALAEGFALKIAEGKVPKKLCDKKVLSLEVSSLIAGTKYRGAMEKRLRKLLSIIVGMNGKVILFIDEIHNLVGAGSVSGGSLDAANMLKPGLVSGKFSCIGATTRAEYQKYFEKDRALSRRFEVIDVSEPSPEETIDILRGLKDRYEAHHGVRYKDTALVAAVKLSNLYLREKHQPDKSIDLIDKAGSRVNMFGDKKIVDKKIIEQLVSESARIPEETAGENEKEKLKDLENRLKEKIFGQDEAVAAVVKAVKRSRAGFRAKDKPEANFLFAGPTGVGKTELCRQLAEILGVEMIRFDMSEYQEKYSVSRLVGSSPGYVGYEEGGRLTEAVRKNPHAVVLLDEIEKAHPDIFNILLQIMDYATLTDNHGRKADFRNVIFIMTSNAGAGEIGKSLIGFGDRVNGENSINSAVERIFTPEFRNRLDAVVRFGHLSRELMVSIVKKELDAFAVLLAEKNVAVKVTQRCAEKLAEEGYCKEFGARNVSRLIEEKIKTFFVDEVLFGRLSEGGGKVTVDWNGEYRMEILDENNKKEKKSLKNKRKVLV